MLLSVRNVMAAGDWKNGSGVDFRTFILLKTEIICFWDIRVYVYFIV